MAATSTRGQSPCALLSLPSPCLSLPPVSPFLLSLPSSCLSLPPVSLAVTSSHSFSPPPYGCPIRCRLPCSLNCCFVFSVFCLCPLSLPSFLLSHLLLSFLLFPLLLLRLFLSDLWQLRLISGSNAHCSACCSCPLPVPPILLSLSSCLLSSCFSHSLSPILMPLSPFVSSLWS